MILGFLALPLLGSFSTFLRYREESGILSSDRRRSISLLCVTTIEEPLFLPAGNMVFNPASSTVLCSIDSVGDLVLLF